MLLRTQPPPGGWGASLLLLVLTSTWHHPCESFTWVGHPSGEGGHYHIPLLREQKFDPTKVLRRLKTENTTTPSYLDYLEVPLGIGMGTHFAELHFGVPPQKASVIVDTGSHITAMPCRGCTTCGTHTDPPYDLALSTTVRYLECANYPCRRCQADKCRMSLTYSEGSSWEAVMVNDLCWIGSIDSDDSSAWMESYGVRYNVGCQTHESGLFISQVSNGIMGFAHAKSTLTAFMKDQGKIKIAMFAMCFGHTAGRLTIGGIDANAHTGPLEYVPYTTDAKGWYRIVVLDIYLGSASIGGKLKHLNQERGVIVDSGTTDTYFPSSLRHPFQRAFEAITGFAFDAKDHLLTLDQVQALPSISYILAGVNNTNVTLVIPATQYLELASDGHWYTNLFFNERTGGVLGASSMMNHDVIFNLEKQQVGFARANCDTDRLMR